MRDSKRCWPRPLGACLVVVCFVGLAALQRSVGRRLSAGGRDARLRCERIVFAVALAPGEPADRSVVAWLCARGGCRQDHPGAGPRGHLRSPRLGLPVPTAALFGTVEADEILLAGRSAGGTLAWMEAGIYGDVNASSWRARHTPSRTAWSA